MEIEPTKKVIYIVRKNHPKWKSKKMYKDCSDKEKEEANLMEIPTNDVLLDYESEEGYQTGMKEIEKYNYQLTEIWETHSEEHLGGKHVILRFKDLDKQDLKVRNEIRRILIKRYKADETKHSELTFIPIPNKPHYKSGKIYSLVKETGAINSLLPVIIMLAKQNINKTKEFNVSLSSDVDFKDYFEKDILWKKLSEIDWTKMPMTDMGFNSIISKNLAIASVRSGKNEKEIKKIVEPLIEKVKGYKYGQFEGWLRRVRDGEFDEYNYWELNKWSKKYLKIELYEMIHSLDLDSDSTDLSYITSKELEEEEYNVEFLVDNFIIKNGVTMFSGAQASCKSMLANYLAICVATGESFFGLYKVEKGNVLIIDEENGRGRLRNRFIRFCNDMKISLKDIDIDFMIYQNIKMDNITYRNIFRQYIIDRKPALIICDSMVRMMVGDEDKAKDVRKVFETIKNLNVAWLLLHHQGKGVKGVMGIRGSGDWSAMCDNTFCLESHGRKGDNIFEIKHEKVRDAELVNTFKFKVLDVVDDKGNKNLQIMHLGDTSSEKESKELSYKVKKWIEDNNIENFKTGDIKKEFNFKHYYLWKPAKDILISNNIIKETKPNSGIFEVIKGGGFSQLFDIK